MRDKIFLVVFLVFGLIGMIRNSDYVSANDQFFMHVNVVNDGEEDLEDLSVKILFYDLGIILRTNPFDLNEGDNTGKLIFWDVPSYVQPGNYLVRISLSNDDIRDVRHRIVTIV
jgi:hypothetical protein